VSTAREIQDELKVPGRRLRAAIPEVYAGYAALHGAAMGDGALPARVKELIALAIAVTKECDGCVVAHARSAVRQGVTAAEVAEAMGVAILMNGGPGTVWGPRAYAAFEEFAASAGQPAGAAGEDKAARSGEVSPPGS
jgi:AhpD family alkylhydroperoxidase